MGYRFPWRSQVFFWEKQCAKFVKKNNKKINWSRVFLFLCLHLWGKTHNMEQKQEHKRTDMQTWEFAGIELKQNITSQCRWCYFSDEHHEKALPSHCECSTPYLSCMQSQPHTWALLSRSPPAFLQHQCFCICLCLPGAHLVVLWAEML